MVNCSQCQEEISNEARICPKCGHPQFQYGFFVPIVYGLGSAFITFYIMSELLKLHTIFNAFIPMIVGGFFYVSLRDARKE